MDEWNVTYSTGEYPTGFYLMQVILYVKEFGIWYAQKTSRTIEFHLTGWLINELR